MKKNSKTFSFSEFMSFNESLVDSLDAISDKVTQVTEKLETLEAVIQGDESETVAAEDNVAETVEDTVPESAPDVTETDDVTTDESASIDEPVSEPVADDTVAEDVATESKATVEEPVATDDSAAEDEAAIDAMSEEDTSDTDGNFSNKYLVVGLKQRPWGNVVISEKQFSEDKYRKLIPTVFSTKAQAQRALTSYNITGENFSIRYNNVKSILNM